MTRLLQVKVFYRLMSFLSPGQQCQSTEGYHNIIKMFSQTRSLTIQHFINDGLNSVKGKALSSSFGDSTKAN